MQYRAQFRGFLRLLGWMQLLPAHQEIDELHRGASDDFTAQDCAAIARSFGWLGIRVEDPAEFKDALHEALGSAAPAFIDVVSADQIVETPPVAAWQEAEQKAAH